MPMLYAALQDKRQLRWDSLNLTLRAYRLDVRLGWSGDGFMVDDTFVTWPAFKQIYDTVDHRYGNYNGEIKPFPEADYEVVSKMFGWIRNSLPPKNPYEHEDEPEEFHLIATVLWAVCQLLPDVKVEFAKDLVGKRVYARSHVDFLLTCGSKRVCVVHSSRFCLATPRCLISCEVWISHSQMR